MATVRFSIRSPRPGYTGEGAGEVYFRDGLAELAVDLDDWTAGNNRGALSYFRMQGFEITPLDGVSVAQAMADPSAEADALLAEKASLQRQLDAETARDDVDKLRAQVDQMRADRAARDAAAREQDAPAAPAEQESVKTDVPPPAPDAPVADWRAYAVEIDPQLDDKAAKALSKDVLVATYGGAYAPQDGTVTA